jgi:hypothetical protein
MQQALIGVKENPPRHRVHLPYALDPGMNARMQAHSDDPKVQFAYMQKNYPRVVRAAEALVASVAPAHAELQRGLTQVAQRLGFQMHHNPEDEAALADDNDYVFIGPLKSVSRVTTKSAKKGGDVGEVRDILRGTVAMQDLNDFPATLHRLSEIGEILHVDDRMSKPTPGGYRDYQVILKLKTSGQLVEMLILPKPMLAAKKHGHAPYEEERALPTGHPRKAQLNQFMHDLYNGAWMRSRGTRQALAVLGSLALALAPVVHK